jgi:hypothetical protein
MADQKISQLTAATTPLAGTEELPLVQGGVTKKATVANVREGLAPYETGTWTPTLAQGASAITYNSQLGKYVKIGRMVHLTFAINADFTSTGAVGRIGNFPFQNANDAGGGNWLSPGQGGGSAMPGLSLPITPAGTFQAYFVNAGVDVVFTGGTGKVVEGSVIYMTS